MYWKDEGYLLSKSNFSENSIIIEAFTAEHGKYSGLVYGGSSRKQKKKFQIGNKILLNFKSKNENSPGYFAIELIEAVAPRFFDNKKKSICLLGAAAILKILLPERQINKKIYSTFDKLINMFNKDNWIKFYILWEFSLIKELGFEFDLFNKNKLVEINNKSFSIPDAILNQNKNNLTQFEIKEALIFNKNLLIENFIAPNKLKFPNARNILEKYY